MKRIISVFLTCLIIGAFCTACSSSGDSNSQAQLTYHAVSSTSDTSSAELNSVGKALMSESSSTTYIPATTASSKSSVETSSYVAQNKTVAPKTDDQSVTVYITKTGKKYHTAGCRYLSKSEIAISLKQAKAEGYTPCSVCNPPQ